MRNPVHRILLVSDLLAGCARMGHTPPAVAWPDALGPLARVPTGTCDTFTPTPGTEGLTRGILLQLSGAAPRRIRAGVDAAGRPRIVTVVAEGAARPTATASVSSSSPRAGVYVELQLDTTGHVVRGWRMHSVDGAVLEPMPRLGLPLTPQDSAAGAALAGAVAERCAA